MNKIRFNQTLPNDIDTASAVDCYYYYYEVRTHSSHTDRKTDEQTDRE